MLEHRASMVVLLLYIGFIPCVNDFKRLRFTVKFQYSTSCSRIIGMTIVRGVLFTKDFTNTVMVCIFGFENTKGI